MLEIKTDSLWNYFLVPILFYKLDWRQCIQLVKSEFFFPAAAIEMIYFVVERWWCSGQWSSIQYPDSSQVMSLHGRETLPTSSTSEPNEPEKLHTRICGRRTEDVLPLFSFICTASKYRILLFVFGEEYREKQRTASPRPIVEILEVTYIPWRQRQRKKWRST